MEQSKGEITAEQVERARWRDELAAAEPVLPTPAEDSPERLRERREALGLSVAERADRIRERTDHAWWAVHVDGCEGRGQGSNAEMRTVYAAALSAEEARRAAVGAWAAGGGVLRSGPRGLPEYGS